MRLCAESGVLKPAWRKVFEMEEETRFQKAPSSLRLPPFSAAQPDDLASHLQAKTGKGRAWWDARDVAGMAIVSVPIHGVVV